VKKDNDEYNSSFQNLFCNPKLKQSKMKKTNVTSNTPASRFVLFLLIPFLILAFPSNAFNQTQIKDDTVAYKTGYVTVNGAKLFYKEAGEGQPMLFVHGGLGTSEAHFGKHIDEFTKKYRVIGIHLRGHGKSDLPDTPFSMNLFADDIFKFLEELKLDSIIYIGYSLGGMTGLNLASKHPEKIKKLITIGAVANHEGFKYNAIDLINTWTSDDVTKFLKSIFIGNPNPDKILDFQKKLVTAVINQNEPKLSEADIKKIKSPTLIICGDNDAFVKIEHQLYLYNTIEKSNLLIVPRCGHGAWLIQPEIVKKAIKDFSEKDFVKF
jgi:pimeloyl-ACP methyl ester carboxylesterase